MKITVKDIIEEAMAKSGKSFSLDKTAAADNSDHIGNIIDGLKNFDKMANCSDDILIVYANLIKEANNKARKKLGWENGLTLR